VPLGEMQYPSSIKPYAGGYVPNKKIIDQFVRGGQFFLPTGVLIRREFFERTGRFDPELKVAYDWDFFLRAACEGKIFVHADVVVNYRVHESQSINSHVNFDNGDSEAVFRKLHRYFPALSLRQRAILVSGMCHFVRRFATKKLFSHVVTWEDLRSSKNAAKHLLTRWKNADVPAAGYVSIMPRHWRQFIAWNLINSRLAVRFLRVSLVLLKKIYN
jgi:hypothetical protein